MKDKHNFVGRFSTRRGFTQQQDRNYKCDLEYNTPTAARISRMSSKVHYPLRECVSGKKIPDGSLVSVIFPAVYDVSSVGRRIWYEWNV